MSTENETRVIDAYRFARQLRPGCLHQLGCRCDPPYWLRDSTPPEIAHEQRHWAALVRVEDDAPSSAQEL